MQNASKSSVSNILCIWGVRLQKIHFNVWWILEIQTTWHSDLTLRNSIDGILVQLCPLEEASTIPVRSSQVCLPAVPIMRNSHHPCAKFMGLHNHSKRILMQFMTRSPLYRYLLYHTFLVHLYSILPSFNPATKQEVTKLFASAHLTTCSLDPIPSQILQSPSSSIQHSLTHIFNLSLSLESSPTLWNMH